MQKKYVFDLDGTLVDSMPHWCKLTDFLTERGIEYPPDLIKTIIALGLPRAAQYFKDHFPLTETAEEIYQSFINRYIGFYEREIPAKDGVIETLRALKKRGVGLNVLTASPHEALDCCLKRLEVYDLFDNVWSCDDFKTSKSNPEIYKMAAERLNKTVGEVIFVDDNVNAVKTAKQAGMISYGIYDESSKDFIAEMQAVADKYVMNFKELLNK